MKNSLFHELNPSRKYVALQYSIESYKLRNSCSQMTALQITSKWAHQFVCTAYPILNGWATIFYLQRRISTWIFAKLTSFLSSLSSDSNMNLEDSLNNDNLLEQITCINKSFLHPVPLTPLFRCVQVLLQKLAIAGKAKGNHCSVITCSIKCAVMQIQIKTPCSQRLRCK